MPLKKKGKGKGKGKGKAKGKGKKGKGKGKTKGSKLEKGEKEVMVKQALESAKLWEARYEAVEKSRQEYRENTRKLISENEGLHNAVHQTERDTIDVIAYLKREDVKKDEELSSLRHQVKELRESQRREREALAQEHSQQAATLQALLEEKTEEVRLMQGELKTVREFRKKRAEMQHQLEQLQSSLEESEREHKTGLSQMEHKFFEEKIRLQKEANRRIADLAEKAHDEAVRNLDERTREVYRENVQMKEALSLHMEHEESLRRAGDKMGMANRQLVAEKELNQQLVAEKISQARVQRKAIKELQEKVRGLEESLSVVVREFEEERAGLEGRHRGELHAATSQLTTLQRQCELQARELNHVKRLSRRLLEQRTEVERFLLESLAFVKSEVATKRAQYCRDAQQLYQYKMLEATRGQGEFPPVRTFRPLETSTNSVYHRMEQAERWDGLGERVDVSELTWEQREQVLRLLFAKMNQTPHPRLTSPTRPLPPLPALEDATPTNQGTLEQGQSPRAQDTVFLTQQPSTAGLQAVSGQVT